MFYLYPTNSAYIYCLPQHPLRKDAPDLHYLSIRKVGKNTRFTTGETILLLYRKNKYVPPGIMGFCRVAGNLMKVSDIPEAEQKYCYNRAYLQLPINNFQYTISRNIIDEDVLYSLPSMNEFGRIRVYSGCNLLDVSISVLFDIFRFSNYWFIWRARRTEEEILQYKKLFIHLSREKIEYKKYLKLSEHVNRCHKCGFVHEIFKPFTPDFFEFHEETIYSVGTYCKIDYKKLIPLCPNCHKQEHEKIVPQSFIDQSIGYTGYSYGFSLGTYNRENLNETFDL